MGNSEVPCSPHNTELGFIMKSLLVLVTLVAAITADAEPQLAPLPYWNPFLLPTLPIAAKADDAEAKEEPEKPALPLVYTHPLTLQHAGCQNNMGQAVPCAYGSLVLAGPIQDNEKVKEVEKRSAESEAAPEADPEADPFFYYAPTYYSHRPLYGLYSRPYYYNNYYYNLPVVRAAAGCQNYLGSLVPCA